MGEQRSSLLGAFDARLELEALDDAPDRPEQIGGLVHKKASDEGTQGGANAPARG